MKCARCNEVDIPEPEFCCNGRECGCMGLPIDPPYCDKCYAEAMEEANKKYAEPGVIHGVKYATLHDEKGEPLADIEVVLHDPEPETVRIYCWECDGLGWTMGYDNHLPIQERCTCCHGAKVMTVPVEFARMIGGEPV